MMRRQLPRLQYQGGVTLIVALIMLVLLTLLALTSFNLGKSNLQIVSNMQQRDEAIAASREVIEETISNTRFFDTPNNLLNAPCDGVLNTRCIDVNGDGTTDIKVALTPPPSCVKAAYIKNTTLDLANAEDLGCSVGTTQNFGVAGAFTGNSECANSVWEVHAVATDVVTEASVEVVQGIAVRVDKDSIATNCPGAGI
jgi:Tfp pilus assembly protein PilX